MALSKPVVENELWQRLINKNAALREALMNPNTDFMTKLLFDAKFLQKKNGGELTRWSNLIVAVKELLAEKKRLTVEEIARSLGEDAESVGRTLAYLRGMAEVSGEHGKHSLNANNAFSKIFV